MSETPWQRFILPITDHFRAQRSRILLRRFPDIDGYRVCDLGGSKHFWRSMDGLVEPHRVEILNVDETAINAAGVTAEPASDRFHFEIYDGHTIERPDGFFDLLLCNSVLEHVPPMERAALAREMTRVSSRLFVQTPARAFPVDPHFVMPLVHWIPRRAGRLLARISPWRILSGSDVAQTNRYFDTTRLLGRRELQALFPDATVHVERFLGLPKSYIAASGAADGVTGRG